MDGVIEDSSRTKNGGFGLVLAAKTTGVSAAAMHFKNKPDQTITKIVLKQSYLILI